MRTGRRATSRRFARVWHAVVFFVGGAVFLLFFFFQNLNSFLVFVCSDLSSLFQGHWTKEESEQLRTAMQEFCVEKGVVLWPTHLSVFLCDPHHFLHLLFSSSSSSFDLFTSLASPFEPSHCSARVGMLTVYALCGSLSSLGLDPVRGYHDLLQGKSRTLFRGAWKEICAAVPNRTLVSAFNHARRKFLPTNTGPWSKEVGVQLRRVSLLLFVGVFLLRLSSSSLFVFHLGVVWL
jgi:hypothetical protein